MFIATPAFGGLTYAKFTLSLVNLVKCLEAAGHETSFALISGQSEITVARNILVDEFLKTNFDALLFLDADHGFGAMSVKKMIESGKAFIGAIYPKKRINWANVHKAAVKGVPPEKLSLASGEFVGNFLLGKVTVEPHKPIAVANVGTGVLFLDRSVFEILEPHTDSVIVDPVTMRTRTEYFTNISGPDGLRLSEDYSFCYKWRATGNEVWAAPWVHVTHVGLYEFEGRLMESVGE